MKYRLTILFYLIIFSTYGQDTTYYDVNQDEVNSMNNALYYTIRIYNKLDSNKVVEKVYFKSGQLKTEKSYSDFKNGKLDDKYLEYDIDGQLVKDVDYKDGKLNGRALTYWKNGAPKRMDSYENDKLIEGRCISSKGKDTAYYDYIRNPDFPGGIDGLMSYLKKEIRYPKAAKKARIQGRVAVKFTIDKDGNVTNTKVVQSVSAELDAEALRVVKKIPKWVPGMQDGELVRVAYVLPLQFKAY